MQFTVPQFIEHEAKVIGPLTFKQFIYVGFAGAICFVLYFLASFPVFLLGVLVLGGGSLALAFVKIGGRSLPTIVANVFKFGLSPKIYIWKKKETPTLVYRAELKPIAQAPEEKEKFSLKKDEESQLKKLRTKIETKS
jgi:hypothetical protein